MDLIVKSVICFCISGHHLGIAIDIAAYTLGASTIERHYTLDRTWKGTDHAASLEPEGIRQLKQGLEDTYQALTYKSMEVLPIEQEQSVFYTHRLTPHLIIISYLIFYTGTIY